MSLNLPLQLVVDFGLAFVVSALSPHWAFRVIGCLGIPFLVSYIAFGPENFSPAPVEGFGLLIMIFSYFVFLGLLASAFGTCLGYYLRMAIKHRKVSCDRDA